jgi:hypothetical protein
MGQDTTASRRWRRGATALGLVVAGAVGGGILASTLSANAAGSGNPSPAPGYGMMRGDHDGDGPGMHHDFGGSGPVRGDEKSLSSADAAKVRAAALKAVPGSSVYRVETDAGDGAYEAHMTKKDGTPVTVKLDQSFTVTKVEAGMGLGDPTSRQVR